MRPAWPQDNRLSGSQEEVTGFAIDTRRREAERVLPFRRVQKALREADPAGAKSVTVRGKHQVLGSQRVVFDDPRPLPDPRDQDQCRCVIEDLEVRTAERRPPFCQDRVRHPPAGNR